MSFKSEFPHMSYQYAYSDTHAVGGGRSIQSQARIATIAAHERRSLKAWTDNDKAGSDITIVEKAVDTLRVLCWCESAIVVVPQEFVRQGWTITCNKSRKRCQAIEDAHFKETA